MVNVWYCDNCGHFKIHNKPFLKSKYSCSGCGRKRLFGSPFDIEYKWAEKYVELVEGECGCDMSADEFERIFLENRTKEPETVLREILAMRKES